MTGLDVLLGLAAAVTVIGGAWALFKWTWPKVVAMSKRLSEQRRKRKAALKAVSVVMEDEQILLSFLHLVSCISRHEAATHSRVWDHAFRLVAIESALKSYGKWEPIQTALHNKENLWNVETLQEAEASETEVHEVIDTWVRETREKIGLRRQ